MTQNEKPVLIVTLVLVALIVVPLLLLLITRVGGSVSSGIGSGSIIVNQSETDIPYIDLRHLNNRGTRNSLEPFGLAISFLKKDASSVVRHGFG